MKFSKHGKVHNKKEAVEFINNRISGTSSSATIFAFMNPSNPKFMEAPEVVLYLNEVEERYNLYVELPLDASFDREYIYIFDKYFDDQTTAIEAFFKKVPQIEKAFEIELEIDV